MKKRKLLYVLPAMVMALAALTVSAGAAPAVWSVEELAHMDLDGAPASLRDDILAARAEIVYGGQSWTVDGAVSIVNLEDGTIEALPEFSELFPGWEIPASDPVEAGYMPSDLTGDIEFGLNVRLELSQGGGTPDFSTFAGNGRPVAVYAQTSPGNGARYNIGFTDRTSGRALGWACGLSIGRSGAVIDTEPGRLYGVCGGACDAKSRGWYRVAVSQDLDPDPAGQNGQPQQHERPQTPEQNDPQKLLAELRELLIRLLSSGVFNAAP